MNMGKVQFITKQEYDIYIRPDTGNPRYRYLIIRIVMMHFLRLHSFS